MKASIPRAEDESDDDDDDDGNVEHPISGSELDEHASSDTEGDQAGLSESEHDSYPDEGFDLGFLSAEASDTDDLVHLDAEVPDENATSAAQESSALGGGKKRKHKGLEKGDLRIRKKKLRALPTFASYEDFAQMIEDEPEENV